MPTSRLESEVTGTVWKIEVHAGEVVREGQTLVILESMKMEIPLVAPHAGSVLELMVEEGEAVTEGQPLVVIG
ncbi:MAG TPA: acetyl-CoA carboxylase biotin carboxyl carrier protein subunit [Rubrivivax sp.]|jgi:acetyl-CoA carboxylase biotin carboxyl carrier protein|nr:acetyl-CoA carboxylase biotin carboxyl carrier protein subunit [Rubrivivax sp.]